MGVAGLPALAGVILAVALGGAGVRLARRELAGTRLILIESQRGVDLRITARD
jgi:hypothetical protein